MRKTMNNDKQIEVSLANKKNTILDEGVGALLKDNPFKGGLSKERKT